MIYIIISLCFNQAFQNNNNNNNSYQSETAKTKTQLDVKNEMSVITEEKNDDDSLIIIESPANHAYEETIYRSKKVRKNEKVKSIVQINI